MYLLFKRCCDIVFSGAAILLVSPFLIPVIIGLKFTGEGCIWFQQERLGYKKKSFVIWKFATMLKDSAQMPGGMLTSDKDPRITSMGKFLRKSKLNELPQLFNIFLGKMSFVGPRPLTKKSFDAYPPEVQKVIYNTKPGLTGIGSIVFRNEGKLFTEVQNKGEDPWKFYNDKVNPMKGTLEIWYQKQQSFLLDIKLLILTAWQILFPRSTAYKVWFKNLPKSNCISEEFF